MQTVTLVEGQGVDTSFNVQGSDGQPVPAGAYTATAAITDPTVLVGPGSFNHLTGIKAGETSVTWTLTPKTGAGYSGAPLTLEADTFIVSPKTLVSGTPNYSVPA